LRVRNRLGLALVDAGRYDEATTVLQLARRTLEERLGEEHPLTLTVLNDLGVAYAWANNNVEARAIFERLVTVQESVVGPHDRTLLTYLGNLAEMDQRLGKHDEALALYLRAE